VKLNDGIPGFKITKPSRIENQNDDRGPVDYETMFPEQHNPKQAEAPGVKIGKGERDPIS
jgi:hypothetical protein